MRTSTTPTASPPWRSIWCSSLLGYYNITRTFYSVSKHNGRSIAEKTRQVFIKRHHEDTPFDPQPTRKQKLF